MVASTDEANGSNFQTLQLVAFAIEANYPNVKNLPATALKDVIAFLKAHY